MAPSLRPVVVKFLRVLKPKDRKPPVQPIQPPPPVLPRLPPELLDQIFRETAEEDIFLDPLDHDAPVSFFQLPDSPSIRLYRLQRYRRSLHQKTILARVCRSWNRIAQELLYEFVWIHKASQAKALALTLLSQMCETQGSLQLTYRQSSGNYIRRLHIETPALERCDPADLRTILDYAPHLVVYSDHRSVRRNIQEQLSNPRSSPEQLFSALARPGNDLRRLSWTNYDLSFNLHASPMLSAAALKLEYLELTFCSPHFHGVPNPYDDPCQADPSTDSLHLPALRSLKVTLDNSTFSTLSTWNMPALRNLSVVSADFSYAGCGFARFFMVHGPKLLQLELGHSSSIIEEHYLTAPPNSSGHQHSISGGNIPLPEWCPNLVEFICSAEAEWNWQNPNRIAPHVLMPYHPKIKLIGIKNIDKRLKDDAPSTRQLQQLGEEQTAFFVLLEQMGSLTSREAFPALKYIRDMSWQSHLIRTGSLMSDYLYWRHVHAFWGRVLEKCRESGLWLEDWEGINVTARDLRKAEHHVEARFSTETKLTRVEWRFRTWWRF